MAVKLEGAIHRYVGLSTDTKPTNGYSITIPAGSSFLETDTGRIYRYTGEAWQYASPDEQVGELLTLIYLKLNEIGERFTVMTS